MAVLAWRGLKRPPPQRTLRANPGPALAELAAVVFGAGRPAGRAERRLCSRRFARPVGRRERSHSNRLTRDSRGGGCRRPVWSVGDPSELPGWGGTLALPGAGTCWLMTPGSSRRARRPGLARRVAKTNHRNFV